MISSIISIRETDSNQHQDKEGSTEVKTSLHIITFPTSADTNIDSKLGISTYTRRSRSQTEIRKMQLSIARRAMALPRRREGSAEGVGRYSEREVVTVSSEANAGRRRGSRAIFIGWNPASPPPLWIDERGQKTTCPRGATRISKGGILTGGDRTSGSLF